MRFISTRSSQQVSIRQAISQGLAADGGLFVPELWPQIAIRDFKPDVFADFFSKLLQTFFVGDEWHAQIPEIARAAFNFPLPLQELGPQMAALELFHGPTSAFKDFGARFLACLLPDLQRQNESGKRSPLVVVATSGDTGGAVASAFSQFGETQVAILFPLGRISSRQQHQLTAWGNRVRAFAVEGNFDDCQSIVKEVLASDRWRLRYDLLSANSINLGRLLPQLCYAAYVSMKVQQEKGVVPTLVVPSGNLGDAVAALWAKRIGFPIGKVILAHNANRAVVNYFASGRWQPLPTVETLANAMDVGNPSNFERLKHLFPTQVELAAATEAYSVSDQEIRDSVASTFRDFKYAVCPHTAAGLHVAKTRNRDYQVIFATAHPAKFETIVEPLIGQTIPLPKPLQEILQRPAHYEKVAPTFRDFSRLWDL